MNGLGWRAAWRIARRDLHLGFRGLRLLFLCLFLGVATLAAIGSLTSAITQELRDRGRVILGGDVEIGMTQRQASLGDKQAFECFQFSRIIQNARVVERNKIDACVSRLQRRQCR